MNNNVDQLLKLVGENEHLKGSYFTDVLNVMKAGEFIDVDEEVDIKAGEKVIGEMNDLEKALYTMVRRCSDDKEKIIARFEELSLSDVIAMFNSEKKDDLAVRIAKNENLYKFARTFLWSSLRNRFADKYTEDSTGLAIRKGFKVTLTFESQSRIHVVGVGFSGFSDFG